MPVITYPYWDKGYSMLVKRATEIWNLFETFLSYLYHLIGHGGDK